MGHPRMSGTFRPSMLRDVHAYGRRVSDGMCFVLGHMSLPCSCSFDFGLGAVMVRPRCGFSFCMYFTYVQLCCLSSVKSCSLALQLTGLQAELRTIKRSYERVGSRNVPFADHREVRHPQSPTKLSAPYSFKGSRRPTSPRSAMTLLIDNAGNASCCQSAFKSPTSRAAGRAEDEVEACVVADISDRHELE